MTCYAYCEYEDDGEDVYGDEYSDDDDDDFQYDKDKYGDDKKDDDKNDDDDEHQSSFIHLPLLYLNAYILPSRSSFQKNKHTSSI